MAAEPPTALRCPVSYEPIAMPILMPDRSVLDLDSLIAYVQAQNKNDTAMTVDEIVRCRIKSPVTGEWCDLHDAGFCAVLRECMEEWYRKHNMQMPVPTTTITPSQWHAACERSKKEGKEKKKKRVDDDDDDDEDFVLSDGESGTDDESESEDEDDEIVQRARRAVDRRRRAEAAAAARAAERTTADRVEAVLAASVQTARRAVHASAASVIDRAVGRVAAARQQQAERPLHMPPVRQRQPAWLRAQSQTGPGHLPRRPLLPPTAVRCMMCPFCNQQLFEKFNQLMRVKVFHCTSCRKYVRHPDDIRAYSEYSTSCTVCTERIIPYPLQRSASASVPTSELNLYFYCTTCKKQTTPFGNPCASVSVPIAVD